MVDAERESSKPSKTGSTLGIGQFASSDKNGERVGDFQWPQCGHFDYGALLDGIQHGGGVGRRLTGMHPTDGH